MSHLLVLAGGFGTRLRSAVPEVPKPLAPVAGRPYLHYLNSHWVKQGVTELTYLLHYQPQLIEAFLQEQQAQQELKVPFRTIVEPEPMGTGGAIAHAVRTLGIRGSFLVTNADTWLGGGLREMATATAPAIATIEVTNVERYGSVETSGLRITRFCEKQEHHGSGWINAGLYHLHSGMFDQWDGRPFSIERDVFPALAQAGQLEAIALREEFIDIGVPEDYFRFCRWIESGKREVL